MYWLLPLLAWSSPITDAPPTPNVIIMVCDDAGWADFGFQGASDVPTPNLDALAASGTVFERGYVTASVCSPSRAGLISGRYQQRFGHEHNMPVGSKHGMPGEIDTIAERLKGAGWSTAAVGKWHLGYEPDMRPQAQGFDHFHGQLSGSRPYTPLPDDKTRANYRQRDGDALVRAEGKRFDWLTEYFGDRAALLVRELAPAEPYLLYVSFTAPHGPMQAPPEDLEAIGGEPSKRTTYIAMQRALDRAVGDILQAVEASSEAHKTVIWFVNDNGGATNNGSDNGTLRGMKGSKFEGGVRVPMIVRWPGVTNPGSRYSRPVSTMDITASTIACAQADASDLDGVDLRPYLSGSDTSAPHEHLFWRRGPVKAVIDDDRWKLIVVNDAQRMLFDLQADPGEGTDVSAEHQEVVVQLSNALQTWSEHLQAPRWSTGDKWIRNQIEKHQPHVDTRAEERSLP